MHTPEKPETIDTPTVERFAFEIGESDDPGRDIWMQLSEGELSPEDALGQARDACPELDERELRRRVELYAPPPEATRNAELALALTLLDRGGGHDEPEANTPAPTPIRSRIPGRLVAGGAVASLAAAASLVIAVNPDDSGPDPAADTGSPSSDRVPGYRIEFDAWTGDHLGPDQPDPTGQPDAPPAAPVARDRLRVTLRPESAVHGAVELRAWAQAEDGSAHPLALDTPPNGKGVFSVDRPLDELPLGPGRWKLLFAIGPQAQIRAIAGLEDLQGQRRSDIQIVRETLHVIR